MNARVGTVRAGTRHAQASAAHRIRLWTIQPANLLREIRTWGYACVER